MVLTDPKAWISHYGEEQNAIRVAESTERWRGIYGAGFDYYGLSQWPAWELEPLWENEWPRRWENCGGVFYDGRMIAMKSAPVWGKLSGTFPDGLGNPYPQYSLTSYVYLKPVGDRETWALGVASWEEIKEQSRLASDFEQFTRSGDEIRKWAEKLRREQNEKWVDLQEWLNTPIPGEPAKDAPREEWLAFFKKKERQRVEKAREDRERVQAETVDKNRVFRLLETSEYQDGYTIIVPGDERWEILAAAVNELVATPHFDSYPKWKARAWLLAANMQKKLMRQNDELECLREALRLDPKLPIKRRIKSLS
ncbi:MAG: hypothetical protein ABIT76_08725 [Chthoniobacterales bacterium]